MSYVNAIYSFRVNIAKYFIKLIFTSFICIFCRPSWKNVEVEQEIRKLIISANDWLGG